MWKRKNRKSEGPAEVNLIPFIDLLSVCISFLLFTAVWIQAGALSTKQGLGTETQAKKENELSLWVELESQDSVLVSTRGLPKNDRKKRVSMNSLSDYAAHLKKVSPDLRTGLVLPNAFSSYDELVRAMNSLKKAEITDLGISPL